MSVLWDEIYFRSPSGEFLRFFPISEHLFKLFAILPVNEQFVSSIH
jgi:hypothetical protein